MQSILMPDGQGFDRRYLSRFALTLFAVLLNLYHVKTASAACNASFNPPSPLCVGQSLSFDNTSNVTGSSSLDSCVWDWDDNTPNTTVNNLSNVSHTFNSPGSYQVCLTVYASNCTDSYCLTIAVSNPPLASFTSNASSCASTPVTFNGSPTNGVSYSWNFDDPGSGQNSSTQRNPTHTFGSSGPYDVCFTVTSNSSGCSDDTCRAFTFNQTPEPALEDSNLFSPFNNCGNSSGLPGYSVTVNNITANPSIISSYSINWGDGTPATNYPPNVFPGQHTYATYGTFNLTVTATGTNGCVGSRTYEVVNETNPSVGIASPGSTNGCAPRGWWFRITQFQGNSPGTTYRWDFGDGSPNVVWTSPVNVDSIFHLFTTTSCGQPGNAFTVTVTARNACDSTTATVNNIRVGLPPDANFNAPAVACANTAVPFTNASLAGFSTTCTQQMTYNWNFGDPGSGAANISTLASPSHTFATPGNYSVRLIVTAGCGSDTIIKNICVVGPPTTAYTLLPDSGCAPLTVNTSNTSSVLSDCTPGTISWSVGYSPSFCGTSSAFTYTGGTGSNSSNPSFQFTNPGTYNVVLTASNACGASTVTRAVRVKAPPTVTLATIPNFCGTALISPTANVTNCGTSAISYNWSFSGGNPSSSTSPSPTGISYTATGNYTVSLTVSNECGTATSSTVFRVNPIPIANAGNSVTICRGSSTSLTGSATSGTAPYSYNWSPSTGLNTTSGASVVATPTSTTTYTLTVIDANGCSDTSQVVVNVNPLPAITLTATNTAVCLGQSTTISVQGPSGLSYTWSPGGQTGSSITVTPTTIPSTSYTVTATDANGCSSSTAITISVRQLPSLTVSPTSPSICGGGTATMTASGASTYTWSPSTALNTTIGPTVIASPTTTTTYTVTGTDASGCSATTTVTVGIGSPPVVNCSTSVASVCPGSPVTLTGYSSTATTYTWLPGGQTTASITLTLSGPGTYVYSVIGRTNISGCSDTCTVSFVVNTPPIVNINPSQPTICLGQSATLTASGASSYSWSTGATGSALTITPTQAGTFNYTVTGTDANGCTGTAAYSLGVVANPPVIATANPYVICQGGQTTLSATGATTYSWSPSTALSATTGSTVTANPTSTTIYTVTGTVGSCTATDTVIVSFSPPPSLSCTTSAPAICLGRSVTLSASGASTYSWSPGGQSGTSITIIPTAAGNYTYTVIGSNNGSACADTCTVSFTVNALPIVTATAQPSQICPGDTTTLFAAGASTYAWTPSTGLSSVTGDSVQANPSSTTIYTVTGTDANGCTSSASGTVSILSNPTVSVTSTSSVICPGGQAVLAANGASTYVWTPSTGLSATTGGSVIATPATSTTYTVTGTVGSGCTASATVTVTVNPLPTVACSTSTGSICLGQSVNLTGSGATNYSWSPGGQSGSSITITPSSPGSSTYTVIGSNTGNGCADTCTVSFVVHPLPVISVSATPIQICPGDSTTLSASGASSYVWSPAVTLSASTGNIVRASPTTLTTYTVTGTDGNTCSSSATVTVDVLSNPTITITNSSPVICPGGSSLLSVIGASSYTWSPSIGLSVTAGDTVFADPPSTTTYMVVGTIGTGCSTTATTTVTVNQPPSVNIFVNDSVICVGENATLQASGATAYSWQPGGQTTSSITVFPSTTTVYTVIGSDNGAACADTAVITVVVNPLPIVSATALPDTICQNQSSLLSASGALTYTWLSSINSDTLTVSPSATTSYTVVGTDANGCTGTASTTVSVLVNPLISVTPSSAVVCTGSTATLSAGGASTYDWSPAAGLNTVTGSTVIVSHALAGSYQYTVIGTISSGCTGSAVATVTVNNPPSLPPVVGDDTICIGESTTLGLSGATDFFWSPAVSLSATTGASVVSNPQSTITYTVVGTDPGIGCADTVSVTVTVNPLPIVSVTVSAPVTCAGFPDTLFASGAVDYTWSPNSNLTPPTGPVVVAFPIPSGMNIYTVTGTDANGCVNTATDTIMVNPLPQVVAGPDQTFCNQSIPVTLAGNSPPGGTWSGPFVSPNGVFTPSGIGVFDLTYTYTIGGTGCSDSALLTITVDSFRVADAGINDTICLNEGQIILSGYYPPGGAWSGPGLTVDTLGTFIPTASLLGCNLVTYTYGLGTCNTSDTRYVCVDPPPVVSAGPPQAGCENDLSFLLTGFSPPGGSWYGPGIANPNQPTFTTTLAGPGIHTLLYVYTDPSTGCSDSSTTTATVYPNPVALFSIPNTLCINIPFTPVNYSTGDPTSGLTYAWDFGDGNTYSTVSPSHAYANAGVYTVTLIATNPNGCDSTFTQLVTVIGPPEADFSTSDSSGCGPLTVVFTDQSTGFLTTNSYYWDFGLGQQTGGPGPHTITYPSGLLADTTYFIQLVTSNQCGSTSHEDSIVVHPTPTADFGTNVSSGCSPLDITFSNITVGNAQSYFWDFGNGSTSTLLNPPQQTYLADTLDVTYNVTLIASNNCGTDTAQRDILVRPNTISAFFNVNPSSGCAPLMVTFTNFSAGGVGLSASWDFGDGNFSSSYNSTHTFTQGGNYNIQLIISNGCSYDTTYQTITVYPQPALSFSVDNDSICSGSPLAFTNTSSGITGIRWDFGDGSTSVLTNPTHLYGQPGTYTVQLIANSQTNGCPDTIYQDIVVLPIPQAAFSIPNSAGCVPLDVQFSNSSSGASYYLWDFDDGTNAVQPSVNHTFTVPGTYQVRLIAFNTIGCSDSAYSQVLVNPVPSSQFAYQINDPCNLPVAVYFNNTSSGAVSYQWDFDNGGNSTQSNPSATLSTYGIFDVVLIAYNQFGCSDTSQRQIPVSPAPVAAFGLSQQDGCEPLEILFSNGTSNGTSYFWTFGDGSSSTSQTPSHSYLSEGVYSVSLVATSDNGCRDTASMDDVITVSPSPVADFTWTYDTVPSFAGGCQMENLSIDATSYQWNFGDGTTSTEENPDHRFDYPGEFIITLVADRGNGCLDTIVKSINIDYFYGLFVPNAFTPLTGVPEVRIFKPAGVGIKEYHIWIYNKWGNVLWESTELENGKPKEGWDGYYKGELCQQDAYVWKVWAVFENGVIWPGKDYGGGKVLRTGTANLIR